MHIPRRFTNPGQDPFALIKFASRSSRIVNPDGSVVFEMKDIQVPENGPTRISIELAEGVVFTALSSAILQRLTPGENSNSQPSEQKGASA